MWKFGNQARIWKFVENFEIWRKFSNLKKINTLEKKN